MATKIQVRRDSAANWTSANPVLDSGEFGYETDTGKVKVGNGTTAWSALGYIAAGTAWGSITGTLSSQTDLNTALAAKVAYPSGGSDGNVLVKSGTAAAWSGVFVNSTTAEIATQQTTTSTTYVDLATAGPSVTLSTGTKVLVLFGAIASASVNTAGAYVSVAVSGATNVSASDSWKVESGNDAQSSVCRAYLFTGLTAGVNTFTLKYRTSSTHTGSFSHRFITVIDMGS